MIIITHAGLTTSASWWANCRVEGNSVVLSGSLEDGESLPDLAVAELHSEGAARAMFTAMNMRIQFKARMFDAREWSGHVREETSIDTTESRGE